MRRILRRIRARTEAHELPLAGRPVSCAGSAVERVRVPRMIRHSAPLLAALLALILLWAPLPFGGVTPWAGALLAALCFAALALAAVAVERPPALRPAALPAAALAGLSLLGLPAGRAAAGRSRRGALAGARGARAAGGGAGSAGAGAADAGRRGDARRAALGWAAAAAVFLAAAVAGQRREHRRWLGAARARRGALPGLLRRPRLVRPRQHALGGRPARPRPAPARHLRQPQPPRGLPGNGAGGRLRLELVGRPPRPATSRGSSAGCCWPRRRRCSG